MVDPINLSILCVHQNEPSCAPLRDLLAGHAKALGAEYVDYPTAGGSYVESYLDKALQECSRGYILRIDDDESLSTALVGWLLLGRFRKHPHWKFPRMHLWADRATTGYEYLDHPRLFPDHQTRCSIHLMSGGRRAIHAGSPFGGGELAPCAILHHKFQVKTRDERRAIWERYERLQPGAGLPMRIFSEPEAELTEFPVKPVGDGSVRE